MELELIEPEMYFKIVTGSAERMARTIAARSSIAEHELKPTKSLLLLCLFAGASAFAQGPDDENRSGQ